MAKSPFEYPVFRWYFAVTWVLLAAAYTLVVKWLLLTGWMDAVTEGTLNWLLLLPAFALGLLLPRFYLPANVWYIYAVCLGVILSYGCTWMVQWIGDLFVYDTGAGEEKLFVLRWFVNFMVLFGSFTAGILWSRTGEREDASRRQAEINEKMRDAELHKLQHQLQPHFLFNSLNSINALVQTDPVQARDMVQKLSDFLRFTLKRADEQWVSLEHEMEYLNLYLDIEKIRFRHRLELAVEIQPEAQPHLIPTLILQPIVENAIKFGLYGTTGKVGITLKAMVQKNQVYITVTNPFDTEMLASNGGTGFGLKAIRRRLQLLYNRNDLLQTGHHENIYSTTLNIPVKKP